MITSYEMGRIEDWRPVSSETSMAVYAFARGYRECGDTSLLEAMNNAGTYLLSLQHESGAILNCKDDCMDASLQNNKNLCDLVYTYIQAAMHFLHGIGGE